MGNFKHSICTIDGCGRKHVAHGYCMMHYKRQKKNGTTDYRWGGVEIGKPCSLCDRPVVSKGLCSRHYQMLKKHGDPSYSDRLKKFGLESGLHNKKGYLKISPVLDMPKFSKPSSLVTRFDKTHKSLLTPQGLRDGSNRNRSVWLHRKIAGAKIGEVVHHIDLDRVNNNPGNLFVCCPAIHAKAHRSLERLMKHFLDKGMVKFDRDLACYVLSEYAPLSI